MKNLSKCQETVIIQQETYQITYVIKSFINSLTEIYPGQINTTISQIISFTRKLEENDVATKFFMAEKQQKTILNFSVDSLIVTD